jgi:acyl-[acyl-carrier-protein]-phospholipid O-acyltransferase/long-chain-fatty-acid--[acyl-carrier-protein] ligase
MVETGPDPATRTRFGAMALAYFLGVFNDNYYKQAILILAVGAGLVRLQGLVIIVFTLPFLVLAAPAGWVADRFPKRTVVIASKWTELLAVLVGAVGLCAGHWPLIFAMLGIMGAQATFFSPALNGSIPELFPEEQVVRANGILRMLVTLAILSGIALAGITLDLSGTGPLGLERGRLALGAGVVLVAVVGLIASYGVLRRPAADPRAPFPWTGPLVTLRDLLRIREDRLLGFAVAACVFIWFAGSLQVLLINPLGLRQLALSKSLTSALIVAQLLGIGVGGLLSGRWAVGPRWHRVLAPSAAAMGLVMVATAGLPWLPPGSRLPAAFLLMGLVGVFGGLFLIPVESFIQTRPEPARRGAVLAAANFVEFAGILLSGPISNYLNARWTPTFSFGLVGVLSLLLALAMANALRRMED